MVFNALLCGCLNILVITWPFFVRSEWLPDDLPAVVKVF